MATRAVAAASQNAAAQVIRRPTPSRLDPILFYGVFGLLLFAPAAFGAVDPLSIFILKTGSAVCFVLWVVRQVRAGELQVIGNPLFLPMLAFAVLVALQLALGRTAYRYETLTNGHLYIAYGLLGFLLVQGLRRTSQLKMLTWAVSAYGLVLAALAVLQSLSSSGRIYWLRNPGKGWFYGPYFNHNHYAGLMELLVPVPLVYALTRYARGPRQALAAGAAAVMASSIFLSGSRGGMAAFAVEMGILGSVTLVAQKQKRRKTVLALAAFLVIVVGLLAWLGGGEVTNRMASIHSDTRKELSGGTRVTIDRDALRMFRVRPVLGWGLGTFPDVYPQFRTFYTNFFVNEAHNDYLQLLVEMGALGFAVMLWFLVTLYRRAVPKLVNWPSDTNGAVALAAMLGVSGILVHSLVDFNLQIPANAALFYSWCLIAAMEPCFNSPRRTLRRHDLLSEVKSGEFS